MSTLSPYFHPEDPGRGPMIMGLTWTVTSLAIIAVILRFYARYKVIGRPGLDDWLMAIAMGLAIVSQSFITVAHHYGLGKHDVDMIPNQLINTAKWMWMSTTPGLLGSMIARLSIATLLIRLFGVHKWFKWFLIVTTGLCVVAITALIPCTYLQVTPVSGNWDPFVQATRWNLNIIIDLAIFGHCLFSFTDLTFVLLPTLIIWRLNMGAKKRLGLVLLMSMSLLTMTLSIIKTDSLHRIYDAESHMTDPDVVYNATLVMLWSGLEQAFVIMMGSVPAIASLSHVKAFRSTRTQSASILQLGRSPEPYTSHKSMTSPSASNDNVIEERNPYQISYHDLKMSKFGSSFTASAMYKDRTPQSQNEMMLKDGILVTTEVDITSGQGNHDIV